MSPKDKGQLAHEHLHVAQAAVGEGRLNEAVNALFYAAEAAVVALADEHGDLAADVEELVEAAEARA